MNHREPPQRSAGARRAFRCLSLLLLPALAPVGAQAMPRPGPPGADTDRRAAPNPYLPAIGAPPLRFQEASPPPDLVTRPAAAAPPTPALTPTESSVALANAAAARSAAVSETPVSADVPPTSAPGPAKPATAPAKTPSAILPDSARPAVRPEDFLPYFQVPGASQNPSDVTLPVPAAPTAPAALPNSSATYRQTK